jgi:hypothetical protein
MPVFEIQTPDGKTFEVEAPDQNAAIQALSGMGGPQPKSNAPESKADYWGMMDQAMNTVTMDGAMKLNAAGGGLIDATMGAVKGDGFNYSDNYNKHLAFQRGNRDLYNEQNPIRSGIGTGAGLALGITNGPVIGNGIKGAIKTGLAYGAGGGALQDANSIKERLLNTAWGAGTGAAIGGVGYKAGELAGKGITKFSRAMEAVGADPQTKAAIKVRGLADDMGGAGALQQKLDDLGPDAMNVDALGEKGLSVGRSAANIDPMARETLEASVLGRKAGQNQRVVSDMEKIAGIPTGRTKTVEQLTKGIDDKFRPQISSLYTKAREAGKDMPIQFFDDVLKTKQGQAVYREALSAVQSRARLNGTPGDVSNLAVVDEMKKIFDSKASSAFASADKATGGLYADFAKNVRTRADAYMNMQDDPIYAEARALAQQAYKAKDAITMGETLGSGRIALDAPAKASSVDLGNRQRLAQGYVSKKADTLLNRGSTEGALNELSTPMGKKAADAALGADNLAPSMAREKTFNRTAKALTGNSSTARQLAEMGASAGGGAATAAALGYDASTGGLAGILAALTKKGVPALSKKLSTDAQRKAAPLIAQMLVERGVPPQVAAKAPGVLERLTKAGGNEKLMKALLMLVSPEAQKANPLAGTTTAR